MRGLQPTEPSGPESRHWTCCWGRYCNQNSRHTTPGDTHVSNDKQRETATTQKEQQQLAIRATLRPRFLESTLGPQKRAEGSSHWLSPEGKVNLLSPTQATKRQTAASTTDQLSPIRSLCLSPYLLEAVALRFESLRLAWAT